MVIVSTHTCVVFPGVNNRLSFFVLAEFSLNSLLIHPQILASGLDSNTWGYF